MYETEHGKQGSARGERGAEAAPPPESVNVADKLARIDSFWNPHIVGDVNDMHIKVVKMRGSFDWHHHDDEDELFFVVRGTMLMKLRTGDVSVGEGEFIVVPSRVEHCPVASSEECHVMLIERKTTLNTGTVETERTRHELKRL